MRFQAGLQIILLITAAIIVFSVIKPKLESIKQVQAEASSYRAALDNIGQYNSRLQELISQTNSLSSNDKTLLYRYLPERVSTTEVARDISNIASQNGLLLLDIIPGESEPVVIGVEGDGAQDDPFSPQIVIEGEGNDNAGVLMAQSFQVQVVGSYDSMKGLLRDIERNAYPLKVIKLDFALVEDGTSNLVQYTLVLETYSLSY